MNAANSLCGGTQFRIGGELAVRLAAHFHTGWKANWWTMGDDLPQFPEAYVPQTS